MAANNPPEQFVTNPYCGNINPTTTTGSRLYKTATEPLDDAAKVDPSIKNAKKFLEMMKRDSQRLGWGPLVNKVPYVQDGNELQGSILKDFKELDTSTVRYFGLYRYIDEATADAHVLAETFPADNDADELDPAHDANDRDTFYAQVRANMIGERVLGSISEEAKKTLMTKEKQFTWTCADGSTTLDGPTMLQLIVEDIKPSTRIGISNIKDKLRAVRLSGHNNDVKAMCDHIKVLYNEILTENGTHEDIIKDTFSALESSTNPDFNQFIKGKKSDWEMGEDFTLDELVTFAVNKYNNLSGKWDVTEKSDSKIAALVAQVQDLKTVLTTLRNEKSNSTEGTKASDDSKNTFLPIAEWRKKQSFGASVEKEGRTWYWCPKHHGKDYDGLYVTHKPEDHGNRNRRGKKDDGKNTDEKNALSSSSGSGKLAMKDSLKSAMVTKFGCTAEEADRLWSDVARQGN